MKTLEEMKNIVLAVSDDVRLIRCCFNKTESGKMYDYVCPAALAETLERGDVVAVTSCSNHGNNVGTTTMFLEHVSIDEFDEDVTYQWAFQKIDMDAMLRLKDWHSKVAKKLHSQQRTNMRSQVLASLGLSEDMLQLPKMGEE